MIPRLSSLPIVPGVANTPEGVVEVYKTYPSIFVSMLDSTDLDKKSRETFIGRALRDDRATFRIFADEEPPLFSQGINFRSYWNQANDAEIIKLFSLNPLIFGVFIGWLQLYYFGEGGVDHSCSVSAVQMLDAVRYLKSHLPRTIIPCMGTGLKDLYNYFLNPA